MPLISSIGRRSTGTRLLHAAIYAVLVLGAVAMIYPFLIMVSGSMKSAVDVKTFDLVPAYLRDDLALYRKHMEGLFNERLADLQICYDADASSFETVKPPDRPAPALTQTWRDFLAATPLPSSTYALGYVQAPISRTMPLHLRRYKKELMRRFDGRIDQLNAELGAEYGGWSELALRAEDLLPRRGPRRGTAWEQSFTAYKERQPAVDRYYFNVAGFYKTLFLKSQYTRDIATYNHDHGTAYRSYDDVCLARAYPAEGTAKEREDWETFVRHTLNLTWVRVEGDAAPAYRAFLAAKYHDVTTLNRAYGTAHAAFGDVEIIDEPPPPGPALSDWEAFIEGWMDPASGQRFQPDVRQLRIRSVETLYQDYLRSRFGTIEALNRACGTAFADFARVLPPQCLAHYEDFLVRRSALRWEFATRNFKTVADYVLLHGRGALNTAVYCALAMLCALVVNPLAAYALSRFRLPSAYKILLFLLLTMAFPPMVTQIPNFLMLRDLHLLNTFAALVLPVMANGYSIFLLKGFFDALPRELYESASIDGASEWSMFWNITMSLSRPILAVIALNAFQAAYAAFMFALLICQDEKMWTLMVWLYQLQSRSGQGVIYASLLLAALPTLAVFLFCQKIILRGIVLPSEK